MLIVVVLLVAGGGYFLYSGVPQTSEEMPKENSVRVVLNEQNDSGESGIATLVEQDGKVVVTVELTGAPSGVVQPSHIHSGTCANTGSIVYPLEFPKDGKSVTTLSVSLSELAAQMPLLLNVHKSTVLASVYVSCGELSF